MSKKPSPDDLRDAARRRLPTEPPAAPRRRTLTGVKSFTVDTVAAPYSPSNIARGEPLGPAYVTVTVKLPADSDTASALADATATGDWPSVSAIARDWLGVGAAEWRTLTSNTTTEGNTTT